MSMRYNDYEQVLALPFTDDMIRQLALEADFRNMSIGELLAELITGITKKNLVREVLKASQIQLLHRTGLTAVGAAAPDVSPT